MLKEKIFDSWVDGHTALIIWGVHGNEPSGPKAVRKLVRKIASKEIELQKGSLILIEECNKRACQKGVRYIDHDLNRIIKWSCEPVEDSNEYQIALELIPLITEKADIVLDLHSTSGESEPFFFAENGSADFAKKLGLGNVVSGWSEIGDDAVSWDIETYARKLWKTSMTYESGNHLHVNGARRSYRTCLQVLHQTWIIDLGSKSVQPVTNDDRYNITDVYVLKNGPWNYTRHITNFCEVEMWDIIGVDGDNEVRAFVDGHIILPKQCDISPGQEVFFMGYKN